MAETKSDTVPNLGFKDKEKALETLEALKGRDPDYQKLAIKGLIGRANRVISITKAEDKIANMKEAMKVFDQFLKDFEKSNMSRENMAYLPGATVELFSKLQKFYDINNQEFIKAYTETAGGDYKKLRTIDSKQPSGTTWDIVRNNQLKALKKNVLEDEELWTDEDVPTKLHTQLILWAYSPEASKLKKNLATIEEKIDDLTKNTKTTTKRKSASNNDEEPKKKPSVQGKKKRSNSNTSE